MKTNRISIGLDHKILVDFRSYAGGKSKAASLLKKWVTDYVYRNNLKDEELLESHRVIRENLSNNNQVL